MPKNKNLILLVIVFIFGAVLRLTGLFHFTPSLNWDEVSLGYNSYSILQTGADEWGTKLPLLFRAYGDYKLPLYIYFSVIPIKIFGLSAFSIRLTSQIAGTLLILVTYLLGRRFRIGTSASLLAALLVAIEPWSLFLSKVALEANLAALLMAVGLLLAFKKQFIWSVIFFGFSVWTYNSFRIFAPLFLFSLFVYYRSSIISWYRSGQRQFIIAGVIGTFLFGLMFLQLFSSNGLVRFNWLSLVDSGAVAQIENSRNLSPLPPTLTRLIHNRPVYFITQFTKNYVSHYLPGFLFIKGGSHYQFSIPGHGLLYWVNLPFFYLGLAILIFRRKIFSPIIIFWLILFPLAGSVTRDSPHTLRAIPFLPLPMLLSAVGLSSVFSHLKKLRWIVISIYLVLLGVSFSNYYFVVTPTYRSNYSESWQYGHSQLVTYLKTVYHQYDRILITKKYGEPHEFILFNWPWDPADYQTDSKLNRYFKTNWYWVDAFAKFQFINDWEMVNFVALNPQNNTLIVASPDNIPQATELDRILFLNGQPAFILQTQ